MTEPFQNEVTVVTGTQKIIVDAVGKVTVVNAGPVGPPGVGGGGGASALADLTDVDVSTDPPAIDDVIAWDGTNWTPAALAGSGETGVTSLSALTDVDLTTDPPADDDLLAWDATASKWTPASLAGSLDHAGLGALDADDHPQYLNAARGDSRYFLTNTQFAITEPLTVTGPGTVISFGQEIFLPDASEFQDQRVTIMSASFDENTPGVTITPVTGQTVSVAFSSFPLETNHNDWPNCVTLQATQTPVMFGGGWTWLISETSGPQFMEMTLLDYHTDARGDIRYDATVCQGMGLTATGASVGSLTVDPLVATHISMDGANFYQLQTGDFFVALNQDAFLNASIQSVVGIYRVVAPGTNLLHRAPRDEMAFAIDTESGQLTDFGGGPMSLGGTYSVVKYDGTYYKPVSPTALVFTVSDQQAGYAVGAHSSATDPHGDRAYADGLVSGLSAGGNVVANHNAGPQLTGTTTETSLLNSTISLPALATGESFLIEGCYRFNNQAGAMRPATFVIKVGSTNLITVTTGSVGTNVTDRQGVFSATIKSTGDNAQTGWFRSQHGVTGESLNGHGYGSGTEAMQTAGLALDIRGVVAITGVQLQLINMTVTKNSL